MQSAKLISSTTLPVEAARTSGLETLKREYLASVAAARSVSMESVRGVVMRLVALGTGRKQLVQWAVEAGHNAGYVRSLLSDVLCGNGYRTRRRGAGRETPQAALAMPPGSDAWRLPRHDPLSESSEPMS